MDDDYSEMIGETPALVRGDTLELPDLGGPGAELSTGLILTWRDRLVFGLEPARSRWGRRAARMSPRSPASAAISIPASGGRRPWCARQWRKRAVRCRWATPR